METFPTFNKHRAVGPGKKNKINKRRAYIYSGLYSMKALKTLTEHSGTVK